MYERNKVSKDVKARFNVLCENMVHRGGFEPLSVLNLV